MYFEVNYKGKTYELSKSTYDYLIVYEKEVLIAVLAELPHSIKLVQLKDYSLGNQMQMSLCAALIHNPKLLVLDDPLVNLDIHTTKTVINLLKSFRGKKTLFISSHDLDLVANLCDRFLIIDQGKIAVYINKSDFESIDEMKLQVNNLLVRKDNSSNKLEWLK